ncbi:MAG: hypothetical protein HY823_13995, partial [Acidobacteria bacterium]|nr:hypothetical protein [Acidobacteriota bacterium]
MKFRIPHLLLSLGLAWGLPGDAQVSPSRAWREQPRRTLKELQPGMPIGRVAYDPRDRWDWLLTWYGGLPSAEHLKARMEITAREMGKYPHLMPRPEGTPQALVAGAAVPAWRPLGPTKESVGSNHPGPDMDSGRLVDIVTHPSNPQILYLATAAGGVFKTTNASFGATGGWSWTNITDSIPSTGMGGNTSVGALAMSPADPNTLFLGLGDKEGSFVSNAASAAVGFFKTTDGGNTWSAPILLGSTTRTHAILPLSGSVVLVGGNKGLFRSGDGGNTFSPITSGLNSDPVWSIQAFSTTEVILTQYLSSSTGKIYYSSDAGLTWTLASISGLPLTPGRMTVSTSPASATQAWGIASNSSGSFAKGVLKSVDKGHTWTYVAAPTAPGSLYQTYPASGQFSGDGGQGFYNHCLVVDPSDINKLMAGANHALYRSLDGGLTWSQMAYGYDQDTVYSHPDYHCWAWSKTGPPVLFIGNDGGLSVVRDPYRSTIPRTGNSGSQTSDPTFIDNRWNQGLNSYEIWKFGNTNASSPAGSRDRVFLGLQDNGGRWRVNDGSGLTNSTAFDSVVGGDGCGGNINAANGDKVMGAYPELQVYRTTDGWNTGFMATTGLTDAGTSNAPFIANLIPDPNDPTGDTIYTHSYKKIYKTTNYGGIWTSIGTTGIDPARSIRAFAISKSSPSRMAVVTSGGLGWGTTDGGSSWTAFGSFP